MVKELGGDRFARSRLDPGGALADEVCRLRSELDVVKKMGRDARGIGAYVYRNTTQSISSGSWNAISFDTEVFDHAAFWTSGSPTRLTIPTTGIYLVTAQVSFDVHATGVRLGRVLRDGTTQIVRHDTNTLSAYGVRLPMSKIFTCSVSQYLEVQAYQTSGGALNTYAGHGWTFFSIWRLA